MEASHNTKLLNWKKTPQATIEATLRIMQDFSVGIWEAFCTEAKNLEDEQKNPAMFRPNLSKEVYGSAGIHRYFIHADGNIVFSSGHALPQDTTKAKSLGFEIL